MRIVIKYYNLYSLEKAIFKIYLLNFKYISHIPTHVNLIITFCLCCQINFKAHEFACLN